MKCNICGRESKLRFTKVVLRKHEVSYYECESCGFVQTEEPYWLEEAYKNPINDCDTGILARNLYLSKITSVIIYFFFNHKKKFLDYSGGYGIFTRLMRDIGFDYYWDDPMTENIFAKSFEYNSNKKYELITAFECFEHFEKPIFELEKMLKLSKNILFSTELTDDGRLATDWWYLGVDHGQHVSFYSQKSFDFLANKYSLNYYSLNGLGLLTEKKLNKLALDLVRRYFSIIFKYVEDRIKPLTIVDMNRINAYK